MTVEDAVLKELGVPCSRPATLANAGFEAYTWLVELAEPLHGETQVALRLYASSKREGAQAREAAVLAHVARSDCPAPRALAHGGSSSAFGVPWLAMTKAPGTPVRSVETLANAAAAVHRIPSEGWTIPPPRPVQGDTGAVLQQNPRLVEAASRLASMPQPTSPTEPCVVHGDFGMPNVLADDSGTFTVIDWGTASLGDRHQDIGRVVATLRHAGNADGERAFLQAYPLATDEHRLRLWTAITFIQLWGFAAASKMPGLAEQAGVKPEILGKVPDDKRIEWLFWQTLEE